MDAPTSSGDASTLNVVPKQINHAGGIPWPEASSIVQEFSLPPLIIYYMAKNPSTAKCYIKMVMSCKYFFEKLPLLVVPYFCGEEIVGDFNARICYYDKPECEENNGECCVKLDLKKLSSQIWLTDECKIDTDVLNYASLLLQKLYRSENRILELRFVSAKFDDFKLLASTATFVTLDVCLIEYDDGKPVMLEKIVEAVPNLESFHYLFSADTSMVTVSTLKTFQNLTHVELYFVPEVFAIKDLSEFMKKSGNSQYCVFFKGSTPEISDDYKDELDTLIDEIIESEIRKRVIIYSGMDEEKLKIMESRYYDEVEEKDNDDAHDVE